MCFYQCINGQLTLLEGDCPAKPCADPNGTCTDTSGQLVAMPCPNPFGQPTPEDNGDET